MSEVKKYATATVRVVEAVQWDGTFQTQKLITEWIDEDYDVAMVDKQGLAVTDLETNSCYVCELENYIIKREDGTVILLGKYKIDRLYTEL